MKSISIKDIEFNIEEKDTRIFGLILRVGKLKI